jgi:hypothetical protein
MNVSSGVDHMMAGFNCLACIRKDGARTRKTGAAYALYDFIRMPVNREPENKILLRELNAKKFT